MESSDSKEVVEYTVKFSTGKKWYTVAGTSDDIYYTVYGLNGESEPQFVNGSEHFKSGTTDEFKFRCKDLGTLVKIVIKKVDTGGWFRAWYLKDVTVTFSKYEKVAKKSVKETVQFPLEGWHEDAVKDVSQFEIVRKDVHEIVVNALRQIKEEKSQMEVEKKGKKKEEMEKEKQRIEKEKQQIEKEKQQIEKEKQQIEKEKQRIEKEKQQIEKEKQRIEKEKKIMGEEQKRMNEEKKQIEEEKKKTEEERKSIEEERKQMEKKMEEEWIRLKYGIQSTDIKKLLLSLESEPLEKWSRVKKIDDAEVWRRSPSKPKSPPITKAVLHLEGVPYELALSSIADWNQRLRWDKTYTGIDIIERKEDWNLKAIYCSFKMPLFCKKRDMVLACLDLDLDPDQRCHIQAMCSILHPNMPPWIEASAIRAETFISGIIIRPVNDGTQSSKVIVITQVDLRGSAPQAIKNSFLAKNPIKWMGMLKAFCEKPKDETDQAESEVIPHNWRVRPIYQSQLNSASS